MTITVRDLVEREVIYCVSVLVSDLLKMYADAPLKVQRETGTDYDELLDLCQRDDWETPVERYIDDMSRNDLVEALAEAGVEDDRSQADITLAEVEDLENGFSVEDRPWPGLHESTLRAKLLAHLKEEDDIEDFAREYEIDPDQDEVYEHWIVTGWLADRLEEKGEVVGRDICGLTIWGRCTTGQAISLDGVIRETYKDLTGQEAE